MIHTANYSKNTSDVWKAELQNSDQTEKPEKIEQTAQNKFCFHLPKKTFMYFIFTYLLLWEFFRNINLSTFEKIVMLGQAPTLGLPIYPGNSQSDQNGLKYFAGKLGELGKLDNYIDHQN